MTPGKHSDRRGTAHLHFDGIRPARFEVLAPLILAMINTTGNVFPLCFTGQAKRPAGRVSQPFAVRQCSLTGYGKTGWLGLSSS